MEIQTDRQTDRLTDRWADMSRLIFAFGDYANAPKHHIYGE